MLDNPRQVALVLLVGIGFLVFIVELVRRRRLKEEYSWLWLLAAVVMIVIGLSYDLLQWLTKVIGAGNTTSTLFFFAIIFLILLCLQYSVKISRLETQVKNLAQQKALDDAKENHGNRFSENENKEKGGD